MSTGTGSVAASAGRPTAATKSSNCAGVETWKIRAVPDSTPVGDGEQPVPVAGSVANHTPVS